MNLKAIIAATAAVSLVIGLFGGAFFMASTDESFPKGGLSTSVVTVTVPDFSMMQAARTLAEQLSHYKVEECTDAWVPGCFPAPVESIAYVGNATLLVKYNMSAPDCSTCWSQLTYRWDGYGFAIMNQTGGGITP